MAHQYSMPPHNRKMSIPKEYTWETLTNKSGDELEKHYNNMLREPGKQNGVLGQIFTKSQNEPGKLLPRSLCRSLSFPLSPSFPKPSRTIIRDALSN